MPEQLGDIVTQFQVGDIPRILPEILLLVLALLVIGSDIFERWGTDEKAQRERSTSAALLTAIGLGMIFLIALLQSGYVYTLPESAPVNFFTNIVRNLQSGGPDGSAVLGAFTTDHLTMLSRLTFIAAAFLTVLLTLDFRPTKNPGEFYGFILFSTVGMCLMAAASELILAFLAVELTSIPLYVLVGYFQTNDKRSSETGMKYFLFGALSSAILLYGLSLTFGFTASTLASTTGINSENLTQFQTIGRASLQTGGTSALLTLGMLFIVAGVGYKIAVVPFHSWSPDVYQGAPTPITAFVSTASKMAGFILLYRLLITTFPGITGSVTLGGEELPFGGWSGVLALLTLLTVLVGNLAALPQQNAKRLLAYSSIAHAGFVLLALLAWASPQAVDRDLGTSSMLYYLIVYTVTNIGAFGALAVVSMAVGGDDIKDLNGLAQRNLGLAVLLGIFVLSLAGVPPLSGFFAKFYVFMAGWESGAEWLVIIAIMSTIVALYYYLVLLKAMFLNAPETDEPVAVPPAMNATLIIASILVILLGIYPNVVLETINRVQFTAGL